MRKKRTRPKKHVHIREVIKEKGTAKSVRVQNKEVFTIERGISSKNRSVGPDTVDNNEVFTIRDFTVF